MVNRFERQTIVVGLLKRLWPVVVGDSAVAEILDVLYITKKFQAVPNE